VQENSVEGKRAVSAGEDTARGVKENLHNYHLTNEIVCKQVNMSHWKRLPSTFDAWNCAPFGCVLFW